MSAIWRRGRGLGRALYSRFRLVARDRGASSLKAITTPGNAGSIAFHRAMGMDAVEVPDYAGVGQPRVVFTVRLSSSD